MPCPRLRGHDGCGSCFGAGTLVQTRRGMVGIEEVVAGDGVWTFDVHSGLWQWQVVERVFSRLHDGLLMGIHAGGEVITATGRHPFWVAWGEALSQRPITEELGDDNLPTRTKGRWVEAQYLEVGDLLLTPTGELRVDDLFRDDTTAQHADAPETASSANGSPGTKVFNLQIAHSHTYTVGTTGVLVHNASPVAPPAGKDFGCERKSGAGNLKCDRPSLRKNLGCDSTPFPSAGHHLIACGTTDAAPTALGRAKQLGFDVNGGWNGWCLPTQSKDAKKGLPLHSGGHLGDYYRCVRSLLDRLEDDYLQKKVTDCNLCSKVSEIMEKLRGALSRHEIWLQDGEPNKGTWSCPTY